MPTYDTPDPISATVDLALGDIRITATDRADTVVEVHPTDPGSALDVRAAEQTRIEFGNGKLLVKGYKPLSLFNVRVGSVDLTIALPTGSSVQAGTTAGHIHCDGRVGDCRLKTHSGQLRVAQAGSVQLYASNGAITVDRVDGRAEVTTHSGDVRVGQVDGSAVVKNSNGDTYVGAVAGDLRLNAANGNISVDRAGSGVSAKTANGSVRLAEVARGDVTVGAASGELEVGIREGSAAWLDLATMSGQVRNSLDTSGAPGQSEETVRIQARTYSGDIVIRRSWLSPAA
ncbi:DUF4097 family beta strand repeat-containing protein [Plantactinospora sp. B5E13]|uniref:DUF4097 family beta strand repeat-containing protein n=1 Tax=unclassified Plantactinospora TaxID=2631981 RepID=UPI00325D12EA